MVDKMKQEYKYNCDCCNIKITGRKAYDIIKKSEYGKGLRGFCSRQCYEKYIKIEEKICENCKKSFTPRDYTYRYCSKKCAVTKNNETRNKEFYKNIKIVRCIECNEKTEVSIVSNKKYSKCGNCKITKHTCLVCGGTYKETKNKFCSEICKQEFIRNKATLQDYRNMCKFKFAIKNYPNEFDFELIKKYGWYSPSNKKNNLNGVSRDHMVSVKYGFVNKIDPDIICHPANCKLMIHNDNVSKLDECSINLKELLKRIKEWKMKE
jgi:hypothetical protein